MKAIWPQSSIEIVLTPKCNMACHNCDAMVRQAPSNHIMSFNQIEVFVEETKELNLKWDVVILTGGEPMIHPHHS